MSGWKSVPLLEEVRGGLLECVHEGMICVVSPRGIVASLGSADFPCYYRSASKPLQSLPAFLMRLPEKYGLNARETAILSGSHECEPEQVEALEGILRKADLHEEYLVMNPCFQENAYTDFFRAKGGPRKLYHNCAGKHLCMMMTARELGEDERDYWKRDSGVQKRILAVLSKLTDTPEADIRVGVDGCGVPVYAVPFSRIAVSYMRLANPELIEDAALREAAARNLAVIHERGDMLSGHSRACTKLNAREDFVAKDGALGVFAAGMKDPAMGLAVKIADGAGHAMYDAVIGELLRQLGREDAAEELLAAQSLRVINDQGIEVGERRAVFTL